MYLLEKQTLIKQLLPPHWRQTIKETVLKVLLTPIFTLYDNFLTFKTQIKDEINLSGQVLVLDGYIKTVSGSRLSNISSGSDFSFNVFLPANLQRDKVLKVIEAVNRYKPAGVRFSLYFI